MTVRVRQSLGDRSGPGMNCIHVLDLCSRSGVFVVLRYHHWDKPCCQTFVKTPSRPWITTEILWWYCGSITASPLVYRFNTIPEIKFQGHPGWLQMFGTVQTLWSNLRTFPDHHGSSWYHYGLAMYGPRIAMDRAP